MKQFRRYLKLLAMVLISTSVFGQEYCEPGMNNDGTSWYLYNIGTVNIDEYTNVTNQGNSSTGYDDYTDEEVGTFKHGETFSLKVFPSAETYTTDGHVNVYIDWNDDGDFDDTDEDLGSQSNVNRDDSAIYAVEVPEDAVTDQIRIRIFYGEDLGDVDDACQTLEYDIYGEVEDYEITVSPLITASFVVSDTNLTVLDTLATTNNSEEASTYKWTASPNDYSFASGSNSTSTNPNIIFSAAGDYVLTLIATTDTVHDTTTINIHVYEQVVAGFSASELAIAADDTVTFTNTSENADSFVWTIDEDTYTFISSDLNDEQPSIQFNEVGTYEVTLTTYNTVGADDSSITIVVYDEPTALFTSNKTVYDLGDTATFTDQTLNGATSFFWSFDPDTVDFVNGTDATSKNPEVEFLDRGSYTVTLISTNPAGADTLETEDYITVNLLPEASFTSSDDVIFEGDTVSFTNTSTNGEDYTWTFSPSVTSYANGTSRSSENPDVIFEDAGEYTVFLTASNDDGQDVEVATNAITVYERLQPEAEFSVNDTNPIVDFDTVTFTDNSANIANEWSWNISPSTYTVVGGAEDEATFSVIFTETGYYDITLIATNNEGFDFEEKEDFVNVQEIPTPIVAFSADDSTPVIGQTITLFDLSTENPTSWVWNISPSSFEYVGSSTQNSQNPEVKFNTATTYDITLVVDNGYTNAVSLVSGFITVSEPQAPTAAFSAETAVIVDEEVIFTDDSEDVPTSWAWSFDPSTVTFQDGTDANTQNPVVSFDEEGTYSVTLIATNETGADTTTSEDYITVTDATPPVASFSASSTTVEIGDIVTFTDASTGDPTIWAWSFDPSSTSYENATSASSQHPEVSFNAAGNYSVTLTATNNFGSDQLVRSSYITVTEPVGDTTCVTILMDKIESRFLQPSDTAGFGTNLEDLDGNTIATTYSDLGWVSGPNVFNSGDEENPDYIIGFISAWENSSDGNASDWVTLGPITIPAQGGTFSWDYDFSDITKRNGFEVLIGTDGLAAADFSSATTLWSTDDNGSETADHVEDVWSSATADISEFAGQEIYIAFHHTSDNQEILVIDNFKVVGCDEDNDDNGGGDDGSAPVADFTASANTANVNTTVNFSDLSTNNPTAWDWDFGSTDITFTSGSATAQNPSVQFGTAGTYTVIMTATNSYGSDFVVKSAFITIEDEDDNGGGNGTDDCNTFAHDLMNITIEGDIDTTGFGLYIEDNDENTIGEPYAGYGFETSGFYYTSEAQDDVVLYLFSNWENSNAGPADDWVTFGPVEVPTNGSISFDYDFADYAKRNGFDVYVGTNGPGADNFTDATLVWSTQDNDEGTANNVQDQFTKAVADISVFAGQKVYFGFHHNANNQDLLVIDNIEISSCGGEPTDDGKIDGDDNTDNGGGDDNGGGSSSDTTCSTLLDFYLLNADVNDTDEANFGVSLEDVDGETWNSGVFGADRTGSWATGYALEGADTNWNIYTTSYWESGSAEANDWFTFGPITIGSEGADLSWTHRFYADNGRNAYNVIIGTSGLASNDFSGGTTVYSVDENDASTAGDTLATAQTAAISDSYAGQEIYVAFQHVGTGMFVLEIDDIKIEGCNAEDSDGGGDNGDGTDDLTASFTANFTTIAAGETVSFTNTSSGNIQAYQWNVSGGDYEYVNGTSNSTEDIDVQFNEEGTFSVYLLTADGVNAPATSTTTTITVSGDGDGGGDNGGGDNGGGEPDVTLPIAAFVADNTLPGASDVVTFTNNSLNTDGANYEWLFEGNPSASEATYVNGTSSTDAEPSLTFEPGVYNVTLIITTDEGSDTLERTNYILAGDPIEGLWNSDFSDAADWTISEGWVIGTAAPAGQYSGGLGAIASSTADNGFALYDADVIGGASTGSITMANAISLSGVTNAAVVLEYYYRNFYDTLMVEYSTDNSAWNVLKMLNDGMAPNDLTANPSAITISAAALDGESQVWFRITYQGSYGGYAAMVDDFAVIEQPNNDLKGLSSTLDYVSSTYAGAVPLSQVEGIQLGASVLNNGVATQTNMQLNAEIINGNGSVVFSSSSSAKEIATGVIDTVFVEDQFIPSATGNYEATYFFSQDELDASFTNNGANKLDFAVTDTVFARAMIPSTFFGANVAGGDTVQLGANYLIIEETEVSSASVQVAWYTGAGTVIRLNVYGWNTEDGTRTLVASSRDYTIGSIAEGELEKVTLSFDEKPTLSPGDYTASVEVVSYANDGDDFVVSCDNVSPIFTPLAATILARAGGGNHAWYNLSTTPHVYLNIVAPEEPVVVSVDETLFEGDVTVYPNPNNGQFTVTVTDINDDKAFVQFLNPIGQVIQHINLDNAAQKVDIRSSDLAQGIYYLKVVSPTTHSVNVTKVFIQ